MIDTTPETKGAPPIEIYANPGWLWIVCIPSLLNLLFLINTELRHPLKIATLTIFMCLLVGLTAWMVHVPHITVTATGVTIRHWLSQTNMPFGDITAWGTGLGAFYVRRTDTRKINATMFFFVDRADRDRLFASLSQRGLKRESPESWA